MLRRILSNLFLTSVGPAVPAGYGAMFCHVILMIMDGTKLVSPMVFRMIAVVMLNTCVSTAVSAVLPLEFLAYC